MASLRIDERGLQDRARGRQGRAPDARREPAVRPAERDHLRPGVHGASLQAPDDRQHGGPRGGVDRGRARLLPHLLRARTTRRSCSSATSTRRKRWRWSTQYLGRVPKSDKPVPRDIPEEPPQTQGAARDARGELAAAGRRRRAPHHLRRPSRTRIRCTSRRRCCPTARARASTASSSTRSSSRWRRSAAATSSRIRTCSSPWRSSSRARRRRRRPTALIAELDRLRSRADHRRRAAAGEEPVRARLHPRPRVEQGQGAAARPRGRHPQRHQDRRRRVRHLHEHDGRRRAARGAEVLHAGEPAGADDHAEGRGRRPGVARDDARAVDRRAWPRSLDLPPRARSRAQVKDWPSERPPRPLPARDVKFPPYQVRTLPNGLQVIAVSHHEQPAVSLRLIVRAGRRAGSRRQAGRRRARGGAARPGDDDAVTPSRSPARSTRSAARSAPAPARDLTFINAVVMKDSLDVRARPGVRRGAQPAFAPEEIERQRQQMLSALKVSYEDPDYIAASSSIGSSTASIRTAGRTPARRSRIAAITREDLWRSTSAGSARTTRSSRSSAT